MNKQLALLSDAHRSLEQARTIDEIKLVRDKAEAIRQYVRAQRQGLDIQNCAAEVKVRAERKAGLLLAEMDKNNGDPRLHDVTRLSDLGIERIQSHRWQRIASIPEALFEHYVADTIAERQELTSLSLYRLAKVSANHDRNEESKTAESAEHLESLVEGNKKFACIYADPPWQYGNQGTRASTDNHYRTMTVEEIAALPVGELAADESHLWLWTTNGFLFECPKLFDSWGFEFKSSYIWVKPQMGIGNYFRNSHEFLLLATRGGLVGAAKDVMSWGEFDRTEHSTKPETIRKKVIERISPGPRLELFGRRLADGWTVWGNEIERTMFDEPEANK